MPAVAGLKRRINPLHTQSDGAGAKLSSGEGALDTLGNRINGLQRQLEHFDLQSRALMSAVTCHLY